MAGSSLRLMGAIIATAVVTSAFWITVYSGAAGGEGVDTGAITVPPAIAQQASEQPPVQPTVDLTSTDAAAADGAAIDMSATTIMTETPGPDGETSVPVPGPSGLIIPVQGIASRSLVDTYRASRSGGRVHNAIDIMAPRGTPILAASAGTVERLHRSRLGGITIYIRSADRQWVHYYAHLDAYAPGLAVGQEIEQGQVIGTVGFTGNASPAGPHLHFAVYRMANGQRWYQGTPVNPYPLLAGRARAR